MQANYTVPKYTDKLAPEGYVRCAEVARELGWDKNKINRLLHEGKIKFLRIGNIRYMSQEEITRVQNSPEFTEKTLNERRWNHPVSPVRTYRRLVAARELERKRATSGGTEAGNQNGQTVGFANKYISNQAQALVHAAF